MNAVRLVLRVRRPSKLLDLFAPQGEYGWPFGAVFLGIWYNKQMSSPLSPWAQRVQQLVEIIIQGGNYEPEVSIQRVQSSIEYFAMTSAKFLHIKDEDIPRENPWIASLMLYIVLGNTPTGETYSKHEQFEAGKYLGIAMQAGWTAQDVLQAIEWCKWAMPNYPSAEQWGSIFDLGSDEVMSMQESLVPTLGETLSLHEQQTWTVCWSLDTPFHSWKRQLTNQEQPDSRVHLPELDMGA